MNMKKFNEKMGKVQKLSKGGMIKKIAGRHYFDAGGSTTLTGAAAPTAGSSTGPNTGTGNGLIPGIGNALGLNNQFQAQSANITPGTNVGQLNQAYTGAQGAINQQQALANQVQPGTTQGLGTQNALTGQLQGVIAGTGPNAAQTALNQNTATNVANQAALMAGQRGSSANAGLLARQAAQQGAATQQQAVGEAANTQAQQQIAAQQQLAGLAGTQVGQGAAAVQGINNAQQNEQNILQGANTAANNANVAMQSNLNNVNSNVAAGNQQAAGNVVNGIGGLLGGAGAVAGLFAKGGEVGHHCAGAHCTDRQHSMHMMANGGGLSVTPPVVQAGGVGPWLNTATSTAGPQVASTPAEQQPQSSNANYGFLSGAASAIKSVHAAQAAKAAKAAQPAAKPVSATPTDPNAPIAKTSFANDTGAYGASTPDIAQTPVDNDTQGANLPDVTSDSSSGATDMASQGPSVPAPVMEDEGGWLQSTPDTQGPNVPSTSASPSSSSSGGSMLSTLASLAPLAAAAAYKGGKIDWDAHFAEGGAVPAMVSPGERYLNPEEVKKVVHEGANPLKTGIKFPGKPKVKGDSLKNDNIPATLQEGGVVIPRHIMNKKSRDHAELFVRRAVHMHAPKGGK